MPDANQIGYIVNAYPVVSETFLVNELRALEGHGVRLAVFPLTGRQDRVVHGTAAEIRAAVHRPPELLPFGWLAIGWAHLWACASRPAAWARQLRDDVARPAARTLLARRGKEWRDLRRRARLFWLAPWVARRARRAGVRHLHAHYAKEPLEVASRVRWLAGLNYSFAAHAKDLYTTPPQRLAKRLRKAVFAVTCHRHGEATLRQLAAERDRRKILRVLHGCDRRLFHLSPSLRDPELILAVGRLTPKKGFDLLVKACARLDRWGRAFRCVVVGEGRLEGRLAEMIRQAGLEDRVELRPFVPQEELAALYRRAAVMVLPARVASKGNRDGIPNVLVEAMACGAPVVATPVGGIPEVVEHGVSGLLVPAENATALAKSIGRLLGSAELRRRLGRAAGAAMARHDFRGLARPLARRFRRLARGRVAAAVGAVESRAWAPGGLAERTAARLGLEVRRRGGPEATIARCVRPSLEANAWRPDLAELARRRLWDEHFKERRARRLLRYARSAGEVSGLRRPRILDLGCGGGGLLVALRAGDSRSVGLDLRIRNCRVTRARGARYGLDLPVCAGRAEGLPYAENSFDLVCLLEVLEHVEDPRRLLAEVRRVCRPTGACVVTVVNRWAHLDPHYRLWGVNFLPRRWARGYIAWRGRTKTSWRDCQTLDDMHYFSYAGFERFAHSIGFEVHDPQAPAQPARALLHRLVRRASLGFNTATVVLVPR